MAAKGKARQVRLPRTIAELEAELEKRTVERDAALVRETAVVAERDESLAQQTATAEVLGVINSSPGDLGPVFDAILQKAHSLCGIASGSLQLYDGEKFRAAAIQGLPKQQADFIRDGYTPGPGLPHSRLIAGEDVVHVLDLAEIDDPAARKAVELGGIRTLLCVALRKDAKLLGMISATRFEVRPFTEKQIALLQNFAAQAVIAMENARLITETREALEQQTATADVLSVINASPGDLAPVFDAILEKATRICDPAFGMMFTFDGEYFHPAALLGVPAAGVAYLGERVRPTVRGGPMERLLAGEDIVAIADLKDDAYRSGAANRRALVDLCGARSAIWVALRKESLLGLITVFRQEQRPFTDKEVPLLQNFAQQAVVAMENARLLGELRQRNDEIAGWNKELEDRVAEQVDELGRVGRLKRFLAPQLAEMIVSQGDEKILESHRREIVVVFCDVRGYTAFTETAEPEEVLDFLREYHGALGPLVSQFEGTLDQFSGDGIMVFFNDPVPIPDPAERAVRMAMAMREAAGELIAAWRPRGCDLGFGAGIAWGYATLGQIGFSDRSGYTAIGTVCNLAARLCDEAKDGQILVSGRVAAAVGAVAKLEELGTLELKGLSRPAAAFNVARSSSAAEARPNLTVVGSGPGA
jgi:class 3 adenylate cyclase/GAF domain-containing protein